MFNNILVAVDPEHDTHIDDLLRFAADTANAHGAKVQLLHVIGAAPAVVSQFLPESYETMASEKIEKELAALAAKVDLAEAYCAGSRAPRRAQQRTRPRLAQRSGLRRL